MKSNENDEKSSKQANIALKITMVSYPLLLLMIYFTVVILFTIQNFIIYPSVAFNLPTDGYKNFKVGNETFEVYIKEKNKDTDLVYFSGNGEPYHKSILSPQYIAKILKYNYVLPVYRGYGSSQGRPNEINLMMDINILNAILQKRKKRVIVIGYSMGSSLAIYLQRIHGNIDRMILLNPMASLQTVVSFIPIFKHFTLFLVDKWENIERIKYNNSAKVLIIYGEFDTLINNMNSRILWHACSGELWELGDCEHWIGTMDYFTLALIFFSGELTETYTPPYRISLKRIME